MQINLPKEQSKHIIQNTLTLNKNIVKDLFHLQIATHIY